MQSLGLNTEDQSNGEDEGITFCMFLCLTVFMFWWYSRVATWLGMRVSAWQQLSCCCFIYIIVLASKETKYTITEVVMKYQMLLYYRFANKTLVFLCLN